ncbi:hypothetical protein ACFSKU_04900 [Pontibacter silvestris]|uniref:Uncharacterized protein n=1 Tax=Pontibacter silvestris TaxID=2305183 RepID=A0ABW4WVI6_9BACT|nr:hypothetical protein [Pontibacter silvestris]MCC9137316.1 hypothetical protein [Pontibacter silvestris]
MIEMCSQESHKINFRTIRTVEATKYFFQSNIRLFKRCTVHEQPKDGLNRFLAMQPWWNFKTTTLTNIIMLLVVQALRYNLVY